MRESDYKEHSLAKSVNIFVAAVSEVQKLCRLGVWAAEEASLHSVQVQYSTVQYSTVHKFQ